MDLTDAKLYEREFDPRGGDIGRARFPKYPWIIGQPQEYWPDTTGMQPEQFDLSAYRPYELNNQTDFPVYHPSGALTPIRWRAWWRVENGHCFAVVFEDIQPSIGDILNHRSADAISDETART